jgi:hypothetical protein
MEVATIRFLAQYLNQLRYRAPPKSPEDVAKFHAKKQF